jgi:hypothetical protein
MEDKSSTHIRLINFTHWSGAAAVLGGVLLILANLIFVRTHGTQSEAQFGTLFGLKAAQYSKVFQPTIWQG